MASGNEKVHVNGTAAAPKVEGIENVKPEDSQFYLANYRAHKTGISHQEMVDAYSEWADRYDVDLARGRYNGPEIAADFLADHFPEEVRAAVEILDVAAGTGRVGQNLHAKGFRAIDALEPSSGMLKVLDGRNVYRNKFLTAIGYARVEEIPSNSYDGLIIAGGMGEGHIPVQAVDEMLRIVKPGGVVAIVMREEYLSYVQEYVGKLEPYMDALEDKGEWKRLSRTVVPEYSFNKNGVVFKYEVITNSS